MFVRQRSWSPGDGDSGTGGRGRGHGREGVQTRAFGRAVADGGYERIPLSEWDRLASALSALDRADVTVDDDRIELRSGSARLSVARDGGIEASMPLHEFRRAGIDALYVDADAGRVQVRTDDGLEYEFRNP